MRWRCQLPPERRPGATGEPSRGGTASGVWTRRETAEGKRSRREVVVARAEEIPPGARKLVRVGGRSIGVFNIGGRFYALRNSCPHQGAELCLGRQFAPLRSSAPGSYEREPEPTIIRCPWHGWEFDIRTGRSWCDPDTQRVRAYPVRLCDDRHGAAEPQRAAHQQGAERHDAAHQQAAERQATAVSAPQDARAGAGAAAGGELRAERYPARQAGPWVVVELGRPA